MAKRAGHPVAEHREDKQHDDERREAPADRAPAQLDYEREQRESGDHVAGGRHGKAAAPVQEPVIEDDVIERNAERERGERDVGPGELGAARVRRSGEESDGKRDADEDRDVEVKLGGERARPCAEVDERVPAEPDAGVERPAAEDLRERADPQNIQRGGDRARAD